MSYELCKSVVGNSIPSNYHSTPSNTLWTFSRVLPTLRYVVYYKFIYHLRENLNTQCFLVDHVAGHITGTYQPPISRPQTPTRHSKKSSNTLILPETPRKRKGNANQRLRGIKTTLPDNLSLDAIQTRLISILKLSYTPDDWQVHLI